MRHRTRTVILYAQTLENAEIQASKEALSYEERVLVNGCLVAELWTSMDTDHPAPDGRLYRVPGVWIAAFRSNFD